MRATISRHSRLCASYAVSGHSPVCVLGDMFYASEEVASNSSQCVQEILSPVNKLPHSFSLHANTWCGSDGKDQT